MPSPYPFPQERTKNLFPIVPLRINAPIHSRRASSHSHSSAHTSGIGRRMFTLVVPLSTFGDFGVLEFIHGGIADLALDDTEAPRINDAWHCAIPRDVFAIVPSIPLGIHTVRH